MTNNQLKELEDKLWGAANALRAYGGLKASNYTVPVLGLNFLKFILLIHFFHAIDIAILVLADAVTGVK